MADSSLQTLTSTLASIAQPSQQLDHPVAQLDPQAGAAPGVNPETPVKRRPGRPKGSGKKPIDPNAEPRVKRPVGRPRKDGLPAGSVGIKRPARPRKRPPGTFASGVSATHHTGVFPYPNPYAADQWPGSLSAPPIGAPRPAQFPFPIDPSLSQDDWATLSRTRPDIFLHTLVSALSAPNPVSAAGVSVEEAFKAHLVSLAPSAKQANTNTAQIPTLYSILKTFWLPSSPMYFSLTASASTARTPPEHRFLYWDPQPLVFNGIACPACTSPLINNGRITTGPLKVYDLGKPFFVIGCEYVCRSTTCMPPGTQSQGRKFASTDSSILRALPAKLKDEFPARLIEGVAPNPDLGSGPEVWSWRGMGVSTALWNMVRASLRAGLRKDGILAIIRGIIDGVPDDIPWAFTPGTVPGASGAAGPSGIDDSASKDGDGEGSNDGEDDEEEIEGDLSPEKEKSAAEEYQDAWNANSGGPGPNPNNEPQPPQPQNQQAQPVMNQHVQPQHPNPNDVMNPNQPPPPVLGQPHPEYPHMFPPPGQQPTAYMPYPYPPPYPFYPPPPAATVTPLAQHSTPTPTPTGAFKRTFALVDGPHDMAEPSQKRVRHCVKCGSHDCKGKGGRSFCTNPCQDCGKLECKGRNSKRPDRTCADAWP